MSPRSLSSALPLRKTRRLCPWRLSVKRTYATATTKASTPMTTEEHRDEEQKEEPHPTASQFLRFGLTGTTRTPGEKRRHDGALDEHLERIFATPHVREHEKNSVFSPAARLDFQGSSCSDSSNSDNARLPDMLTLIEKRVKSAETAAELKSQSRRFRTALGRWHDQIQYEELLASLTAVVARLKKFGVSPGRAMCLRGLFYASRCCSPSALQHYISLYSAWDYDKLPNSTADQFTTLLLAGLRSRRASGEEDLVALRHWLREVIEGPGDTSADRAGEATFHSLLSILPRTLKLDWVGKYMELLGEVKATRTLSQIWGQLVARVREEGEESAKNAGLLCNVNACLQAFVESGEAQRAITAARNLSPIADLNGFITIDMWKLLLLHDTSGMLRDLPSQQTAEQLLQSEVELIETNMGITWTKQQKADGDGEGDGQHQPTAHDTLSISELDTSNPDESFNHLGLPTTTNTTSHRISHRILTLTHALTNSPSTSASLSSLTRLANALTEYEDTTIRLGNNSTLQHEFAWFPLVSPLEFTGYETRPGCVDASAPRDAARLGLLRVRHACGGSLDTTTAAPVISGETIHLMQLGYIGVRNANAVPSGEERYAPTGHILGWDRLRGGFRLLWVNLGPGKGLGTVRPGAAAGTPPASLPYTNATIEMRSDGPEGHRYLDVESIRSADGSSRSANSNGDGATRQWLDLDAGHDLRP